MPIVVAELPRGRLPEAQALLARACAHDRAAEVAEEKLFGACPAQHGAGAAWGAFEGERLVGVASGAGRWLRLLAVEPDARGRGAGGALVDAATRRALAAGARSLRTGDEPGNYLAPGIDARDAETLGFFERRGYARVREYENLKVPLAGNPLVGAGRAAAAAEEARAAGYVVRRAVPADGAALESVVAGAFATTWAFEVGRALAVGGVHLATSGAEIVAFAAHDGNNRGLGWFGPAGTLAAHRGRGLGAALLLPCLVDVAEAGHASCVIAWIGPRAFYEKTAGAVDDRRFVVLEKPLS